MGISATLPEKNRRFAMNIRLSMHRDTNSLDYQVDTINFVCITVYLSSHKHKFHLHNEK
jgi:hypothetical protein